MMQQRPCRSPGTAQLHHRPCTRGGGCALLRLMRHAHFHLFIALLLLAGPWGCSQCQDPGTFGRTYSLITPVEERVEFGDVYLSTDKTRQVAIRSEGNGVVHVSRIRMEGSASFEVRGNTDVVVQPGVTQSWNVVFTPVEVAEADATVIIENNSENRPELRIRLHGVGANLPTCDDQNPCTRDHFDPVLQQCVHVATLGSCDDGNECTTGDTCAGGRCLGAARVCVDPDPCTRDLCEATSGCVFITDIAACDDHEPCTAETCDPVTGCAHIPLADGLPCALGNNTCLTALQCQGGQCVGTPLPDGAPCTDFLACTVDDRCNGGFCSGTLPTDIQVSAATYSFGTPSMAGVVGVGSLLITAESNLQFYRLGGNSVLLVMDVTQRPVQVRQALTLEDQVVLQLAAHGTQVVALTATPDEMGDGVKLRAFHVETDGTLVADAAAATGASGVSQVHTLTVLGDRAWECTMGVLAAWDLPQLTRTATALPCQMVAADPTDEKLWVITGSQSEPWLLERFNPTTLPPTLETSVSLTSYTSELRVLDGVGVHVRDPQAGIRIVAADDPSVVLATLSSSALVISVEPGRALMVGPTGYTSLIRDITQLDSVPVYPPPAPFRLAFHGACAQGTCLFMGSIPSVLLESSAHGAPLTPVAALGMGGFSRVLEVNGDVVAASAFGAHKLELIGTELRVAQSINFPQVAGTISWQQQGMAPVMGDLQVAYNAPVLGHNWGSNPWVDGSFNGSGAVLGTLRAGSLHNITHWGRFVYQAQLFVPTTTDGEHMLRARSFDTALWAPGAPLMVTPVDIVDTTFVEARGSSGAMARVTADGQHLLAVVPFVVPGNDNAVRLLGFSVAQGTDLTLEWSARISTPGPHASDAAGRHTSDAAYAYPDILLLSTDEDQASILDHYRYEGVPGAVEFKGALTERTDPLLAMLFYDDGVAMVSTEDGVRLLTVAEGAPADLSTLPTREPATDLQVLGQRLWVTGNHTVEVFFPPCPPDITPP